MLPKITVDESRCTNPLACRKCLLACPTAVLIVTPKVSPQKFKEIDPRDFRIKGVHLLHCSLCGECANVCPENAIQVSAG
jgi:NADH-quinone oxidoreductase subunit I